MDVETAKATINWFLAWLHKEKVGNICFFGGEPLLNWNTLVYTVNYLKETAHNKYRKKIDFSITTNGTLLTKDKVAFLRKHNFSILISLDSHKQEIQDQQRPSKNKASSFKQIIKGLKYFRPSDKVSLTATISARKMNIAGYLKYFSRFKCIKGFSFVAQLPSKPVSPPNKMVLNTYKASIEHYLLYLFKNWQQGNIIHPTGFEGPFPRTACLRHKVNLSENSCSAGVEAVTVWINGDIYLCQNLVGIENFRLGGVRDGIDLKKLKKIQAEDVFKKKTRCLACNIKSLCFGGCYFINYLTTGRLDRTHPDLCDLSKFKVACGEKILDKIDALIKA